MTGTCEVNLFCVVFHILHDSDRDYGLATAVFCVTVPSAARSCTICAVPDILCRNTEVNLKRDSERVVFLVDDKFTLVGDDTVTLVAESVVVTAKQIVNAVEKQLHDDIFPLSGVVSSKFFCEQRPFRG